MPVPGLPAITTATALAVLLLAVTACSGSPRRGYRSRPGTATTMMAPVMATVMVANHSARVA